jgi:arylformamidase
MAEPRLYDLSPTLSAATPVWPGDTPFSARVTAALAAGEGANVSAITTTTHVGSHADAPWHTEAGGAGIAELPLAAFLGPCRVVEVPAVPLLEPRHLPAPAPGDPPRLLLKTRSLPDRAHFHASFTALSPELAAELTGRRLLLVGLDTPSPAPASRSSKAWCSTRSRPGSTS